MSARPEEPYEALVFLAEREVALLSAYRSDRQPELQQLAREREALIATLPPQAPAEARPALERAAELNDRSHALLVHHREELVHQLGDTARTRRAAHGYGRTLPQRSRWLDRSA
jgi:ABC-type transporter Mla subunit MlaD